MTHEPDATGVWPVHGLRRPVSRRSLRPDLLRAGGGRARLQEKADSQHVRTITLDAPRGTIYDRNGDTLAMSQTMASIYANPRQVKDPVADGRGAGPGPGQAARERAAREAQRATQASSIWLARSSPPSATKVKALSSTGSACCPSPSASIPKGALAPQLLGFVGDREQGPRGPGVRVRRRAPGKPGDCRWSSDLSGNRLSTISLEEASAGRVHHPHHRRGHPVRDREGPSRRGEEFEAKKACAVVMDPGQRGDPGHGQHPVFDTNDYGSGRREGPAQLDRDRPVRAGSTFKMVVAAAALEDGVGDSGDHLHAAQGDHRCTTGWSTRRTRDVPEVRELTVTEILAQSSNIGAVTLGLEVGKDRLVDMIKKFGFTEKLGIDFPGEASGMMLPAEKWTGTTIANVPMGQGIAVSSSATGRGLRRHRQRWRPGAAAPGARRLVSPGPAGW